MRRLALHSLPSQDVSIPGIRRIINWKLARYINGLLLGTDIANFARLFSGPLHLQMNSVPFLRLSSAILLMGAIVAFSPHASADP
ncbi:MAG TPA: hypothetical protein VHE61_10175, partial [Opitutaceae bacterium]|nr:hypothetical protein [Opitutaceae bacterium]